MAVHDIAHVEPHTRDMTTTVDCFVSAMGFTRVADSVEMERSSVQVLTRSRDRLAS
jgi:4-hydroxymandelate synthase